MIKIIATTATELCQIRNSKDDVINPMKQKVMVKNSKGMLTSFLTPIYSGNSFRGKLRRASLEIMMEEAIKKGIELTTMNFHLMNAGGGNNFQLQSFEAIKEVRDANPLVSLFGASLAISGKLVTPNLIPYRNISDGEREYYTMEREDGHIFSTIITSSENRDQFIKSDDALDKKGNARFLTEEQIIAWEIEAGENQAARAKVRNSDDKDVKKVKKSTIKAFLGRDYVIRGIDFYTSLSPMPTCELTLLEYGMLVRALERVVLSNFGSNTARDFGKMSFDIDFDDGSEIETSVDAFGVAKFIKKSYKGRTKEAVAFFEEWLKNDLSQDVFDVAEKMVESKK